MSATRRFGNVPAPGHERRWFEAGDWRVAIDAPARVSADEGAMATFHDALLLEEHAVLLDCLGDCLGESLDWRPAAACEAPFALTLASHDDGGEHGGGDGGGENGDCRGNVGGGSDGVTRGRQVAVVAGASSAIPDVVALRSAHLPWRGRVTLLPHRLSTELVFDRFSLDADDLARCEGGSVMLLPATFREHWPVAMRAHASAGAAPASDTLCEVVLDERFELAADVFDARPERSRVDDDGSSVARPVDAAVRERQGERHDGQSDGQFDSQFDSQSDGPSADPLDDSGDDPPARLVHERARRAASHASHVTVDVSVVLDADALGRISRDALAARLAPEGRRCRLIRPDGATAGGELVALGSGLALLIDEVNAWT